MRLIVLIVCSLFSASCDSINKDLVHENRNIITDTVSGIINSKYPSGKLKESGRLIEGRKNGIWKFYDEEGHLSSVEYFYKNEKLAIVDKNDFIYTTILIDNISIDLPFQWEIKRNYKKAMLFAVKNNLESSKFAPTINILKVPIDTGFEINKFIMQDQEDLKNNYNDIAFTEVKHLKVSGLNAYEMLYYIKLNNFKLVTVSTYIQKGNDLYIITHISEANKDEFMKYNDLFDEIINSFNFVSPH